MSAAMWARGFLQDDCGIAANDIDWVQGGLETPGRRDKFPLNLPPGSRSPPLRRARPFRGCWRHGDARRGDLGAACRPALPLGIRWSGGCSPTTAPPSATTIAAPACFRSCTPSASAAMFWSRHPWLAASVYKAFVAGQTARRCRVHGDDRAQDRPALGARRNSTPRGKSWATISGPTASRQIARRSS